jgi:hypothetical protein
VCCHTGGHPFHFTKARQQHTPVFVIVLAHPQHSHEFVFLARLFVELEELSRVLMALNIRLPENFRPKRTFPTVGRAQFGTYLLIFFQAFFMIQLPALL